MVDTVNPKHKKSLAERKGIVLSPEISRPAGRLNTLKHQLRRHPRRALAGAALLLLLLAGIGYGLQTDKPETGQVANVCTTPMLQQAAQYYDAAQVDQLGRIVARIQKTKGYGDDASCLYVVTVYHANREDTTQAVRSLRAYEQAIAAGSTLNPAARSAGYTEPTQLKARISNLQALAEQAGSNANGGADL